MLRLPHPGPLTLLLLVKVALETGDPGPRITLWLILGWVGYRLVLSREESKGQTDQCEWRPGGYLSNIGRQKKNKVWKA